MFSDIDTSSTVIVNSNSGELFRSFKTDDVEFVTTAGRVAAKNNKTYRHSIKTVINDFTLKCHLIMVGGRNKCYMHFAA